MKFYFYTINVFIEDLIIIVFKTRQILRKSKNHQLRVGIFTRRRGGGHIMMTTWPARGRRYDECR